MAARTTWSCRIAGTLLLAVASARAAAQTPAGALVKDLQWRNIGPANMAGRVTDIDAVESNPAIVYMGAASGGVWKSTNAGTTWQAVFTKAGTPNIGDIAIFQPNPDIVWVGTGESCVRNSVGWGDGIYKSTDGGKTWTNVGLRETHHISEVITHPTDPNIVYVAAQGHLWGHTGERGIYRTRDGGRTWERLANGLPNDGRTGASDLVMDASNPNVLYAAMWERLRQPHRFDSGGPNGGIFKSTDGGSTWSKLSNGLPSGPTGKIGLGIYRKDARILVAIVEHGFQPQRNSPDYNDMTKLGSGIYRTEDGGASWQYINRFNNRPFYYSHIWIDPNNAQRVFVLATNAQISEDGGRTFARSMQGIAGDFHALWVDPGNSNRFYVGNDKGGYITHDGGHNYVMFDNMDIGQFYAVTVDNRDPYWVYGGLQDNGNWGGPSNSRDYNGILNDHWFKFHSGDGFHATVDPHDWRTVYTETQGGNLRRLDAVFRQVGKSITPTPATVLNYSEIMPGAAPTGNRLPRERFRFNWSTPLVLSPHDSRTLYLAGNHLFKSTDRGDSWRIISPDLSTNDARLADPESGGLTRDVSGAETHASAITISESPIRAGVIWVGTDDGNVQLTRDGGKTWTNVRTGTPRLWVSRVVASRFAEGTAYVTLDGHRSDNFQPWVFRTTDFGRTWQNIGANLPANEPVYVITEDLKNPKLLFLGTEFAAYVTVDGGASWQRLMNNLPTVPVHDLVIHPRESDLVAATHGRSVWIMDDITPLQQLTDDVLAADAHLFQPKVATRWRGISRGATRGHLLFTGRNPLTIAQRPPGNSPSELQNSAALHFILKNAARVTLEIGDWAGGQKFTTEINAAAGINRYLWNLRFGAPPRVVASGAAAAGDEEGGGFASGQPQAAPGTYRVKLTVHGKAYQQTLTVRDDPALNLTGN
jgi:photosystem II stability/assembly factor-like uncharacterized protein